MMIIYFEIGTINIQEYSSRTIVSGENSMHRKKLS